MNPATLGGRFVGRAAELDVLRRAVEDARAGSPSVVLVGGEAGMGKTTLIGEAAARSGARLVVGRCLRLGGDVVPLGPLVDLLRHLQRTDAGLMAEVDGLAAFAPAGPGTVTDPSAVHRDRPSADGAFTPVYELFSRLAGDDAVVVAFEDVHWADDTTWDLLELLARNLVDERIVLVGTFRSDEVARDPGMRRRIAELSRLRWVRRVELAGFAAADVAAQVAELTDGGAPADLVDAVLARGEGNPFFTVELVRAHLSGDRMSDVLADLISDDLARLDADARAAVDAAAVIGRGVSHDLLAAVVGVDDVDLERRLRTAIDAQLLVVDHAVDGYHFRHALIAEVVYDALLPSQRRRLHRTVADALRTGPDDGARADRAGQLAFHLDRAGDVPAAFVALLAAADAAQTLAPAVALGQLERAFELWDAAGDVAATEHRCDRLWQAAELATGAVGNARAVEIARSAFAWGVPTRGAAWAHERLGRYLWASGAIEASRGEFGIAADLVAAGAPETGTAAAIAGLAQSELMEGRPVEAERWCRQVLDLVPAAADDPPAWVTAMRVLAAARAEVGDLDAAVRLGREAVAGATDAYSRAFASAYLGIVLVEAGQYEAAAAIAADGGGDARLAGLDRSFGAYFDSEVAEGLLRIGRPHDAGSVIARRASAGMDAFHPGRTRVLVTEALLAARHGDAGRATASLDQAAERPIDPFHSPLITAGVAECHLALGNWRVMHEAARSGWETTAGVRPWPAVRFASLLAYAAVELALDDRAQRIEVDAEALVSELGERLATARSDATVDGVLADVLDAQVRHAEAMLTLLVAPNPERWADVAARWERLPERWMAGDARLREAEARFDAGDAAGTAAALRAAHVIALELSSAPLLGRVEAVSRRTRISVESAELVVVDDRSADRLGLTPREAEVLGLVASGRTNRQIGEALYVSEKTASVHVSNILRKLGVSTRVEAAAVAQRLGLG
ncbi:MAG: AAA family ATPase [Acidimicrobiales bacterium]